jgi:uncharacterized SAM-binding protein YcdF (DUF218 family)
MYYINKIIGFMVSPLGLAIAGGVAAIVCAKLKRVRAAKWIGGVTVAWLWLWMTPLMTWIVGAPLEREFLSDGRVPTVESFPNADAIVLLGGSMGEDASLSPYAEMWASADRVWQAARLWKAGKAPRIIATGDEARESTLGLLKDFGVDEKCVEFLDARNTEEEAKVVSSQGLCVENKKILLVTSAWHMKRARMMFEKYANGVEVVCAPADFEMSMAARKGWSVLPDAYSLYLNSAAVHEWVGLIGYWIFR